MSYIAEQSVIGSLLLDSSVMQQVHEKLKPEMFRSELLGKMYLEMLRAYDRNQRMDTILLGEQMCKQGYPQESVYRELRECVAQPQTSALIGQYAKNIIDEYKTHQFTGILRQLKPSPEGIQTQIGELITRLEGLRGSDVATGKSLKQIVEENQSKYFCEAQENNLYMGFPKLDDTLGGLEGGDVIVIGARPGVGKSAFVTQMAINFTSRGKRVGFFNLEMQDRQVYERFVSGRSGIGITRLRRAKQFLGDEKERFREANEFLSGQDIIISTGSKSVGQIRNESRHMDYDVIIIDYLQLLRTDVRYQSRASEVGAISKAIKALAMELNVPVIALSQLNRLSEMKMTKEPTMAELREAGDIEQDASIIILMWNLTEDRKKKGLKVDKNRQGEYRKIVLEFNGDLMQFVETDETVKQAAEWSVTTEKTPFD